MGWFPEWGKAVLSRWLKAVRTGVFRVSVPGVTRLRCFVNKETEELHPNTLELMEKVAQLIEKDGVQAWFDLEPETLLGDEAEEYRKVTDTLDVWFDSGVTHHCVLREFKGLSWPADLYLEGSDQHRGWFQSSLVTGVAMYDEAPYHQVLTHGFTVDAQGRKMSKSIGNVVAPQDVMNKLGGDILRLWVASADYSGEMTVSDEILKRSADAYRRIRNTSRFLLANLSGYDPKATPCRWTIWSSWIAGLSVVQQIYRNNWWMHYDNYQFLVGGAKIDALLLD